MQSRGTTIGTALTYVLGRRPNTADIPARVLAEIDRREATAERLTGWVQLGIVLTFATLYAVAPRAEGASGASLVPLALSAYAGFTLVRLALSYRVTLPGWFLILSILFDVALLCGLIFSFHIQYGQPAAFYLKAPTMLYLFIFISLRALRFDPRFVLITGLFATLGWMAMLSHALFSDMGEMYITRNYVEYLTSNAILIGAEVDKVITLLGVTLVLSVALYRARDALFDAISFRAAADDLKQFFAPEVARSITGSDSLPGAGASDLRRAAILFVDVRGFTRTAEKLPPAAVIAALMQYQEVALTEIERHGGRIDKFLGDGILATFGAVQDSATYAADAVRAALAVIAALDAAQPRFAAAGWPGDLVTGVGLASGEVTVGVVGAQGRLEFTVIGNAVNVAAKLENANKAMGTRALCDGATLRAALEQGLEAAPWDIRPARTVAGLSDPLDVVVLA